MKAAFLRFMAILVGSGLFQIPAASAGVSDKFQKFVGGEFTDFQGLYIMGGVIVASLLIYILTNHFSKKEEQEVSRGIVGEGRRHHHRSVVKKTA